MVDNDEIKDQFADASNVAITNLGRFGEMAARIPLSILQGIALLPFTILPGVRDAFEPMVERGVRQFARQAIRPHLLPAEQYRDYLLRHPEDEKDITDQIRKIGMREDDITRFKELGQWIPPPADLIRLAVREAFDPALVESAELKYPTPGEFKLWGAKVGVSEEFAKAFWYAHWVLPPPSALFDMRRRGYIDDTELKKWLTLNDFHPLMVDNMMKLNWLPYTRVDVRRMRKAGVVTKEEVIENYRWLGYDDERAKKLSEWVEAEYVEDERSLTKSEIIKAVKLGQIQRDDGIEMLQELGYDEDEADMIVTLGLSQVKSEERELTRAMIENQYKYGIIKRSAALSMLLGRGYSSDAAENIIKTVDYKIALDVTLLPFGYVRSLYREKYMPKDYFQNYLRALGYHPEDIKMVVDKETAAIK